MKKTILLIIAFAMSLSLSAQEVATTKQEKKEAIKSHLKQHFKPYGFVRNYFTFDSRESISGTTINRRTRIGIRHLNRLLYPVFPART